MLPCDIILMAVMTVFFAATVPLAIAHCAKKKKPPPTPSAAPGAPGAGAPGAKSAYKAATVTPSQIKKPTTTGANGPGEKHSEPKKDEKATPKSNREKGKSKQADPQAPQNQNESPCLGALDKTQEESRKSAKSSKTSGEKNHESDGKEDKKEKKEGEKKEEEEKKEPPPIVPEENVQLLGNLDDVIKDTRTKLTKEIEEMGSVHEHDKKKEDPFDPNRHVIINEKKCKMYTTNNEETKEDDAPDDLI